MASKLVWTSDPDEAKRLRESGASAETIDAPPATQSIRVFIDRKRRAGKTVTVASGFQLSAASLAKLASQLKKRCGSGGTAQGHDIEIQGDHVETLVKEITALGYRTKR